MPDDALLDTASRGELKNAEDIGRVARRMLDDPRAKQSLDDFVSQWLRFDRALTSARDHRMFPLFNDRGTLNVGAPADVALLELRKGNFEFLDNYKGTIKGTQRLFPAGTVLGGKRISRA